MTKHPTILIAPLLAVAVLLSGCHLEQARLYPDALVLDQATVQAMEPLERTTYCLAEAEVPSGPQFDVLHAVLLDGIRDAPEQADWSELVCLSLSSQATARQIDEATEVLQWALAQGISQPVALRGFVGLLAERTAHFALLKKIENDRAQEKIRCAELQYESEAALTKLKETVGEQWQTIIMLEEQVQKLKEVELLLQPKQ